jgi:hypothetical protein
MPTVTRTATPVPQLPTPTPVLSPFSRLSGPRLALWGGIVLVAAGALSLGIWQVIRSRRAKKQGAADAEQ